MTTASKLRMLHRNRDVYRFAAMCQFLCAAAFGWFAWQKNDWLDGSVAAFALLAGAFIVWRIRRVADQVARLDDGSRSAS